MEVWVTVVEGKPVAREGDVGTVTEPFRTELGREFSRYSDNEDFERGRELLMRLGGDGISLQRPPLEGFGGRKFFLLSS